MIDRVRYHKVCRKTLLVLVATGLVACTNNAEPDFCRDHNLFHAEHSDSIGFLTIDLAADGTISSKWRLPGELADFNATDSVIDLQFDEDGQLRQIDVSIFDLLPDLEEIEVDMTTPVTRKRFAISRQCERPIFRLD